MRQIVVALRDGGQTLGATRGKLLGSPRSCGDDEAVAGDADEVGRLLDAQVDEEPLHLGPLT